MNFIEELRWRNMFHQSTESAEAHLNSGMRTGYIGFDPTAPALGIGNYVQIMILTLFQRAGHRPIVLMGGATGRVGDPSGKDKERELKTLDELDANLARQKEHMMKLLEFGGSGNQAILRNNLDFYKNMDVLAFLRDVGKTLTVNYMLSKDSVQNRLESGISFTEFSYQLLQAYDFQCLFKEHGCTIQMGGSDQWGNITSGTEFIRRNLSEKAHAITTPLLTKSDGKKFGKSEDGNIWLDPNYTSPYKFYQFWINSDDKDLPKLIRYFTLKTREEVEALEAEHSNNPSALKRILAEELTVRIHSEPVFKAVLNVSELLFNNRAGKETLFELGENDLETVAEEIPSFEVPKSVFSNGIGIIELMSEVTNMLPSKAEAKRAIQGQAVSVNKEKITNLEAVINHESLLHGKFIMLENGKKNKVMLVAKS
ncbi:MAG: tyrosine--tRNA ligase [Bacteroidetes bacterium]|nr:tyrosine--tRNA ligase [Bacteroidota bacterium]